MLKLLILKGSFLIHQIVGVIMTTIRVFDRMYFWWNFVAISTEEILKSLIFVSNLLKITYTRHETVDLITVLFRRFGVGVCLSKLLKFWQLSRYLM